MRKPAQIVPSKTPEASGECGAQEARTEKSKRRGLVSQRLQEAKLKSRRTEQGRRVNSELLVRADALLAKRDSSKLKNLPFYILNPETPLAGAWDGLASIALVFTAVVTPWEVGTRCSSATALARVTHQPTNEPTCAISSSCPRRPAPRAFGKTTRLQLPLPPGWLRRRAHVVP